MHDAPWNTADRAWWTLQNGKVDIVWIYERVDEKIYRRPSQKLSKNIPPWIDVQRRQLVNKLWETHKMAQYTTSQNIDKQKLKTQLNEGLVTVTFTKKNGEQRIMTCTLSSDIIPQHQLPKPIAEGTEPRKRDPDSLSVWDVNAEGWRSFIWENITDVKVVEN